MYRMTGKKYKNVKEREAKNKKKEERQETKKKNIEAK